MNMKTLSWQRQLGNVAMTAMSLFMAFESINSMVEQGEVSIGSMMGLVISLSMAISSIKPIIEGIHAATGVAMVTLSLWTAGIIAAVALVGVIINGIYNMIHNASIDKQLEDARAAADGLQEALNKTKEANEELIASFNEYDSAVA